MPRPKTGDKRAAILRAATKTIAEDGIGASTASIAKAAAVAEGSLFRYFPDTFSLDETHLKPETSHRSGAAVSLVMTLADKEREIIEAALAECGGRVAGPKGAAAKLKIPRQTLDSKIACLNIDKRRFQTLTCLSRLLETPSFASAITVEGTTASL